MNPLSSKLTLYLDVNDPLYPKYLILHHIFLFTFRSFEATHSRRHVLPNGVKNEVKGKNEDESQIRPGQGEKRVHDRPENCNQTRKGQGIDLYLNSRTESRLELRDIKSGLFIGLDTMLFVTYPTKLAMLGIPCMFSGMECMTDASHPEICHSAT